MAFRSWLKLLAATTTAAAAVGAGQLGIAYGLGMVRLDQTLEITQRDQWTAQLAWVAWIAMTAAAMGAVVATGLRPRWSPRPVGAGGALAMGLAAGIGALAVLPLTMQPARAAQVTGVQPVLVIGICAGLGAAAGIFAAHAAAARAVARWNLATATIAIWTIALVSVAPSLTPGKTPDAVRLGVLDGDLIPAAVAEHTPFVTMPAVALVIGLIVGWIARGRSMPVLTVAFSGLAGPALLTVAYLIAGPGSAPGFHLDPYWAAMTASGAGVLGSVLAAIVRGTSDPGGKPGAPAPEALGDDSRPAAHTPAGIPASAGTGAPAAGNPASPGDDSSEGTATSPGSPASSGAAAPAGTYASAGAFAAGGSNAPRGAFASGGSSGTLADAKPAAGRSALPRRDAPVQSAIAQAAAAAAQRPEHQLRPSDTGVFTVAAGRPHPLQDLATPAAGSPFAAGTGSPFGQTAPPAPAPAVHGHAPAPPPAQDPGRFPGQQTKSAGGGLRRGWRTRKSTPEPPATPPSPADTGSFNGFTAPQPGPRIGIDTAEHPRVAGRAPLSPEPTPVSAPLPHPQPIAPQPIAPQPIAPRVHGPGAHGPGAHGPGAHGLGSHGPGPGPGALGSGNPSGPGMPGNRNDAGNRGDVGNRGDAANRGDAGNRGGSGSRGVSGARGPKDRKDEDYADWLTGLGGA